MKFDATPYTLKILSGAIYEDFLSSLKLDITKWADRRIGREGRETNEFEYRI